MSMNDIETLANDFANHRHALADLLIRITEKVDRRVVGDLTAADLKRLGIRITESGDQIVIKAVDSQVDKLIKALLADIPDDTQEAAA